MKIIFHQADHPALTDLIAAALVTILTLALGQVSLTIV